MKLVDRTERTFLITTLIILVLAVSALLAVAEVKPGDKFPDLGAFNLEGKVPDTKGKIVIVDFWASWCGPCKKSFPAMNELQKKFGDKLIIIAVNVDEWKTDMNDFLRDTPATFTVVRDSGQKLVEKTGIATMPGSFILDTAGMVRFTHSGFRGEETRKQYDEEITQLLKP
ncbi:MAG: hypothetical protein RL380_1292 [Verrucomicrobiota bacterium]|jgi:thiol-disulfide isomerase/thioredoxin